MPALVQISFGEEPAIIPPTVYLTSIILVAGNEIRFSGRALSLGDT